MKMCKCERIFLLRYKSKRTKIDQNWHYKTDFLPAFYSTRLSLSAITRSVHCKFNCITVNIDKTQHGIYLIQNLYKLSLCLLFKSACLFKSGQAYYPFCSNKDVFMTKNLVVAFLVSLFHVVLSTLIYLRHFMKICLNCIH